jgi:uncharacterized protein (DUF2141 family)
MKKYMILLALNIFSIEIYANDISINIEILGITINGGNILVGIYNNENSFKNNDPDFHYEFSSETETISFNINIPNGEYVVAAFQDVNNNKILDRRIFNIPQEPCGYNNYNGKGIPGNFNKLKTIITNTNNIIQVRLYKL